MEMKRGWQLVLLLSCLAAGACHDDEVSVAPERSLALSESEVTLPVRGRYYSIKATGIDEGAVVALSDASWLTLTVDTLASDGCVEFFAASNDGETGRDATVRFMHIKEGAAVELPVSLAVHQLGVNEVGENGSETSYDYFRLGYGYNIFKEYMNDRSATEPIINCHSERAVQIGLVSQALGGAEEVDHFEANTLYEMAEMFTSRSETTSSGIIGGKNTTSRYSQSGTVDVDDSWYTYIKLRRTVASASIDFAKIKYLNDGNRIKDLFTENFRQVYSKVLSDPSTANVNEMLKRFGTHLVVASDVGGSLDLTLNFKRSMHGDLNMRAEDFSSYFFYGDPLRGDISDVATNISSSSEGTSAFTICGGTKATREAIVSDVNSKHRVDPEHLRAWQQSMDVSTVDDIVKSGNIAVSFQLTPIWLLFPQEFHGVILNCILAIGKESANNSVSDVQAETDKYAIPIKKASYLNFDGVGEGSLVRVLYASSKESGTKSPTLEICNEYVPAVRGDRRITVIYGCKNGRPFHGAGLFPGDGEGNPPAWLTFSEGQVYVKPIEGKGPYETVDTVYYMHGNVYVTDLRIAPPVLQYYQVEDQMLDLTNKYAIVKIGSGYWTRRDIGESLSFMNNYQKRMELLKDGVLYACTYYENNANTLTKKVREAFSYQTTDIYGEPIKTKWYLPSDSEVQYLYDYIGKNTKSLFKGQVSGFDAAFLGYYGNIDVFSGQKSSSYSYMYKDNYCFFTSKNDNSSQEGLLFTLSKDYKLTKQNASRATANQYPVRLYRTSYYQYADK